MNGTNYQLNKLSNESDYIVFKSDNCFGLKDLEDNIVLPAEFDEIILVPNYFDLLFNTYQVVYRLRKSLHKMEFQYVQPRHPNTKEHPEFSQLTSHKVYYFYKNFSLLDFDGDIIKRLCINGSVDTIAISDNAGLVENNLYGLVRCNDIVNISGIIEPSYWYYETEMFNSEDLFLYELSLDSLPGYLGFDLCKDDGGEVYLHSHDLCPTSSEDSLKLGRWINDASIQDYQSQYYSEISKFDSYGLALVYDAKINKKSYINRYFIQVSDWFDKVADLHDINFWGLEFALNERYVVKDGRLLKLKFSGNFIKDILLQPHKFFNNYDIAVRIFGNSIPKIPFPEVSLYTKFDREYAISILKSEELDITENNIWNVYNTEDFPEKIDLFFRYFFECSRRLKTQSEYDAEYLLALHHEEFGIIPSYSFVESDYGNLVFNNFL
jgi:hypothetical protein